MTTVERAARPSRSDSRFFPLMAVAMTLIVFAGFSPTFYLGAQFNAPPLDPLRIAHGIVFTAWMVLLIAQTGLVAANRRDIHRPLGLVGIAIAAAMVVLGTSLAVSALKAGHAPPGAPSPGAFFAIPMTAILAFLILVGCGAVYRTRLDVHKRLMILATVAILPAAVARIPAPFIASGGPPVFYLLTDLFIVALIAYDLTTRGRVHRTTIWGGVGILVGEILSLAVGFAPPWIAFTTWLAG